jgi:hypothetical protein
VTCISIGTTLSLSRPKSFAYPSIYKRGIPKDPAFTIKDPPPYSLRSPVQLWGSFEPTVDPANQRPRLAHAQSEAIDGLKHSGHHRPPCFYPQRSVQPSHAVPTVRLEMATFCPFIPCIDEDQSFLWGTLLQRQTGGAGQPTLVVVRSGVEGNKCPSLHSCTIIP